MVLLVDDDRNEVTEAVFAAPEEVLVDADPRGPRVEPLASFELEMPIQVGVEPTSGALEVLRVYSVVIRARRLDVVPSGVTFAPMSKIAFRCAGSLDFERWALRRVQHRRDGRGRGPQAHRSPI